ncbi:hypothetical protein ACFQHW_05540 [Lapidilactobacillus achengensis]|uniref:Uncharacterized protein n=1 Tax=Lapidilactobacillus achengensis TaxID=2486000 RepID=A0ABW1UMZ0_9LACO|nr:hypothetical protein [Lapidilactobacillus achengensis]
MNHHQQWRQAILVSLLFLRPSHFQWSRSASRIRQKDGKNSFKKANPSGIIMETLQENKVGLAVKKLQDVG